MADTNLSERAQQVLALTKDGKNPTEIGEQLGITSQGVHGHLRRLREKALLPPDPKARTKAPANGPVRDFNAAVAFDEVRRSIERQRHGLDEHIAGIDRELERLEERKKALKKERTDAEKAKERLGELAGTVVA
jgi:predicted ArsR family transcriptional regulator